LAVPIQCCEDIGHPDLKDSEGRFYLYRAMADQERFEYVYKFVSRGRYTPADRAPSMRIFDEGTLYAARFNANGSGEWLELSDGKNGLDGTAGFASQAEVLITARGAADKAGATPMAGRSGLPCTRRPRRASAGWPIIPDAESRGCGRPMPPTRVRRMSSAISSLARPGGDPGALRFDWYIFALAGDHGPATAGRAPPPS
jgi:hypothetical protein